MNEQQKHLVCDNPNLSSAKLATLTGLESHTIRNARAAMGIKPLWYHKGVGIPFMYFNTSLVAYAVYKNDTHLFAGSFDKAVESVDRLIYCLENNNGKLPPSRREWYFKNLEFGLRYPS